MERHTAHIPRTATYLRCCLLLLSLLLSACNTGNTSSASITSPPLTTSAGTCLAVDCAAHGVTVFVEPEAGPTAIVRAIKAATRSIWVEVCALRNG